MMFFFSNSVYTFLNIKITVSHICLSLWENGMMEAEKNDED